jgi:hypothetical protein
MGTLSSKREKQSAKEPPGATFGLKTFPIILGKGIPARKDEIRTEPIHRHSRPPLPRYAG